MPDLEYVILSLTAAYSFLLQIPQDLSSADPSKAQQQIITCLTVSPSEETLVASTDLSQLYSITLSSADIGKVGGACAVSTPDSRAYKFMNENSYFLTKTILDRIQSPMPISFYFVQCLQSSSILSNSIQP